MLPPLHRQACPTPAIAATNSGEHPAPAAEAGAPHRKSRPAKSYYPGVAALTLPDGRRLAFGARDLGHLIQAAGLEGCSAASLPGGGPAALASVTGPHEEPA